MFTLVRLLSFSCVCPSFPSSSASLSFYCLQRMILRSHQVIPQRSDHHLTMTLDTPAQTTQVTVISDSVSIPPFSGNGSESVHSFIRRVTEECTRRSAVSDAEKLAILKSRVCHDASSLAGKLVKTDKFLSFTKYEEFTAALVTHFAGHSKLGATHSFLKVSQTLTSITRSTSDVYKAENVASSLSSELTDQLRSSKWIDSDDKITAADFKRMMSYFLFIQQLDVKTFNVASDIEFTRDEFLYDVCKKITEKSPTAAVQPVSAVQPSPPASSHAHNSRARSPTRQRSPSRHRPRSRYSPGRRHRSPSRSSRNTVCHRCNLRGHVSAHCRVVLDEHGRHAYNPDAYCSYHNRPGHTLADCRAYQSQSSANQSGNASRPQTPPPK